MGRARLRAKERRATAGGDTCDDLTCASLGYGRAGLSACRRKQSPAATWCRGRCGTTDSFSQDLARVPPRFAALVQDTSIPALLLTVENESKPGYVREARVERRPD